MTIQLKYDTLDGFAWSLAGLVYSYDGLCWFMRWLAENGGQNELVDHLEQVY